jgi:hypothetical protein
MDRTGPSQPGSQLDLGRARDPVRGPRPQMRPYLDFFLA